MVEPIPGLSGPVPAKVIDGLPHQNSVALAGTAVDGPSCHRLCDSHPQILAVGRYWCPFHYRYIESR
eukprot:SAG31_NODE_4477_length_3200_cov_37.268946_2_plen_67_part_00